MSAHTEGRHRQPVPAPRDAADRCEVQVVIAEDAAPPRDPSRRVWLAASPPDAATGLEFAPEPMPDGAQPPEPMLDGAQPPSPDGAQPPSPQSTDASTAQRVPASRRAMRAESRDPREPRPPRRAAPQRADIVRLGLTAERLRLAVMLTIGLVTAAVLLATLFARSMISMTP